MNGLKTTGLLGLLVLGVSGSARYFDRGAEPGPDQAQGSRPAPPAMEAFQGEVPLFSPGGQQIAPYVVDRQPDRIQLAWRMAVESTSRAELLSGGEVLESKSTPSGYQHNVVFEGLQPGMLYEYRVAGFRPCFVSTQSAEIGRSFAIVGHTGGTEHPSHYPDTLLAARINDFQPDFVIHAGDCVYYNAPKDWKRDFFHPFGPLLSGVPVHISPGNHDVGWPFMYGYDLRLFKELFPMQYPKEVGTDASQAFYSVVHGNVEFFFMSYVADMTMDGVQLPWVLREIGSSTATFKVVVFGGMNSYFDTKETMALLDETSVDAIVNGDGAAPNGPLRQMAHSKPRFILGATTEAPSPWLACHSTAHSLTLKEMKADGSSGKTYVLQDRSDKKVTLALEGPTVNADKRVVRVLYKLPQPVSSSDVGSFRFELANPHKGPVTGWVYIDVRRRAKRAEAGFRSQYFRLEAPDRVVTVEIPQENPLGTGPYEILGIQIHLSSKPVVDASEVKNAAFVEN